VEDLTAVLAGAAVYVQLMPSLGEVRRAAGDSGTARDVRTGITMGSAALVGVGVIIALSERSWRPLWLTAGAAALLSGIYETTLRQRGEPVPVVLPPAPTNGRFR
jgi:hypothetical protein